MWPASTARDDQQRVGRMADAVIDVASREAILPIQCQYQQGMCFTAGEFRQPCFNLSPQDKLIREIERRRRLLQGVV